MRSGSSSTGYQAETYYTPSNKNKTTERKTRKSTREVENNNNGGGGSGVSDYKWPTSLNQVEEV